MAEFTGERVIPGEVDRDLLNEHVARYKFAARLARGKRVLDAGCGAGYGSAELAESALAVTGVDISAEAVAFAAAHYALPNLSFEQASCTALPYADGAFDLVVGFEVIEHLEGWREFLLESRRVLAPSGQLIVSTPNRLYYAESRGGQGANPFHVHEFEFEEFREALQSVFPHVALFLENHVEGVTFRPCQPGNTIEALVDSEEPAPADSHFFVAVCAHRPQLGNPTFVYVPSAGNVLRERERHIALLAGELETKNGRIASLEAEHQKLLALFRGQTEELERSNQWAASLDRELAGRNARVVALQEEVANEQEQGRKLIAHYDAELAVKTAWARDIESRLEAEIADKKLAIDALLAAEGERDARAAWALGLQQEVRRLEEQVTLFQASRWMRLGRAAGLGPKLPAS